MNKLAILFIFFSVAFAYSNLLGIRLIAIFSVFSIFILIFLSNFKIKKDSDIILYCILFSLCLIISLISNVYDVVIAMFFWGLICYWPIFLKRSDFFCDYFLILIKSLGFFLSIGVIIQYILFNYFGISFGKIDTYEGRVGFGFIWLDYSFISLAIVSVIPFLITRKNFIYNFLLICTLVLGSFLTSARTGIFSLAVLVFVFVFLFFFKNINKLRIGNLVLILSLIPLLLIVFNFFKDIESRVFNLDDSGRFAGYETALKYIYDNIFIGFAFDNYLYKQEVGVIPHNMFLYLLSSGGILYFTIFLIWLMVFYINNVSNNIISVKISFWICIVGLQFIPSFFSAFFVAIIFSACKLLAKNSKELL